MKYITITLFFLMPLLALTQYTYKNLDVNFEKVHTYKNLALYPIYAKPNFRSSFNGLGNYMPLQQAIQKNKIKITESSAGGTVNKLIIENMSKDTIIIITGDMIKGGKQDRIVEEDMVLNPGSGKKNLKVFCVESGRWSSDVAVSQANNNNLRACNTKAGSAEFKTHFNKGSMGLRKVVEKEKDQQKVWAKVEEVHINNNTQSPTKTYTAISQSADYAKNLNAYISYFKQKFAAEKNVVGVVVVSGNKVLGCDVFATPYLFSSQFESLLHSYATEAIINGKPFSASPQTVKQYADKLLSDEQTQKTTLKQKGSSFTSNGKKLRISSFE